MFQAFFSKKAWAFLFRVKKVLDNKTMIKLPGFREAFVSDWFSGGSHVEQPVWVAVTHGSELLGTVKQP